MMCLAMARPRPVAAGFAGAGFIDAIEAFEQARKVLGGNTGAEIPNAEFYSVWNRAGAEDDASAGSTVFQRVVDQVGEDLMDRFTIGKNGGEAFWNGHVRYAKIDTVIASDLAKAFFGRRGEVRRGEQARHQSEFRRTRRGPG